jgi:hypothetical protein
MSDYRAKRKWMAGSIVIAGGRLKMNTSGTNAAVIGREFQGRISIAINYISTSTIK